jgi:hypothetical protein
MTERVKEFPHPRGVDHCLIAPEEREIDDLLTAVEHEPWCVDGL